MKTKCIRLDSIFKVNLGLLEDDRSAPKKFLEDESWKIYIIDELQIITQTYDAVVLSIPLWRPANFSDNDMDCVKKIVLYSLSERGNKEILLAEINHELRYYVNIEIIFAETSHQHIYDELLAKVIHSKKMSEWIREFNSGKAFAIELGLEYEERFIFINELFESPKHFKEIKGTFYENSGTPILLVGDPRTGKTYTSIKLLHDAYFEKGGIIKYIQSASELDISSLHIYGIDKDIYIYFEDPFGMSQFEFSVGDKFLDTLSLLMQSINRQKYHIILSSRLGVYQQAKMLFGQRLGSFREFFYRVSRDDNSETDSSYSIDQLGNIFEKTAWLKGATWLEDFRNYRNKMFERIQSPWTQVLRGRFAPGIIYSTFVIHPKLLELDGGAPDNIDRIAKTTNDVSQLRTVFNSEILNTVKDIHQSVKAYLLLPAMTPIDEEIEDTLFKKNRNNIDKHYKNILERRKQQEKPYSLRYFDDVFAEAVSQYILHNPEKVFDGPDGILNYLSSNPDVPPEVLTDVLCWYLSLRGQGGTEFIDCLSRLDTKDPTRSKWVKLLQVLFRKTGLDEVEINLFRGFTSVLCGGDSSEFSIFSSLLIQQLILATRVCSRQDRDGLFNNASDLLNMISVNRLTVDDGGSSEPYLRLSLLLHSLLAQIEELFIIDSDKETEIRKTFTSFKLFSWIQYYWINNGQNKNDWMKTAIVLLDAILMKIGELHKYHVQFGINISEEEQYTQNRQRFKINIMKEALSTLFFQIWSDVKSKSDSSDQASFLTGALTFSACWHNRWSLRKYQDLALGKWWVELEKSIQSSLGEYYWSGVRFNINYHSEYFFAKQNAWTRETSIYPWRKKHPRLGADTFHESGLLDQDIDQKFLKFQSQFFKDCLNRIIVEMELDSEAVTSDDLCNIVFIIGMRIPREKVLKEVYVKHLLESFEWHNRSLQKKFWIGVAKVYSYALVESMTIISEGLSSIRNTVSQESVQNIMLTIIDQPELLREFKIFTH